MSIRFDFESGPSYTNGDTFGCYVKKITTSSIIIQMDLVFLLAQTRAVLSNIMYSMWLHTFFTEKRRGAERTLRKAITTGAEKKNLRYAFVQHRLIMLVSVPSEWCLDFTVMFTS